MPRVFNSVFTYPYDWAQTALAQIHKYPNPFGTHVVSMDVLDQRLDEDTGLLRLERIIGVRQGAPKWATKLLGGTEETYVREVTMIDPQSAKLEMTSTNLSLSKYLLVKEYITFTPHDGGAAAESMPPPAAAAAPSSSSPSSPSPTSSSKPPPTSLFRQVAHIECAGVSGLLARAAQKVEDWSFQRFGANADRGKAGLLSVLEGMWGQATTHAGSGGGNDLTTMTKASSQSIASPSSLPSQAAGVEQPTTATKAAAVPLQGTRSSSASQEAVVGASAADRL